MQELNLSLCKMLLDNFNVKNCTIKIHKRNLSVMEKDFDGLMGLMCRGIEVTVPKRLSLDAELAELQGQIWGVDKEMTIDRLRNYVVFTDNPDELFVRKRIRSYNWGRFAFKKLLDEVKLYQTKKTDHVGGCLVFLQLFYLSVVGERMFIIPKSVPPVMTWGSKESNMIYERVAEKGGFNASEGICVTRRYSGVRSTEFSGSRDYSTGLKTNLVDDMFAMRSHISVAEEKVGVLETTVHRMGSDILNLRDAMTALYETVVKLKVRDVICIVDDVLRAVESIECGHSRPPGVINIMGEYCFANMDDWWFLSTLFSDRAKDYSECYAGMKSHIFIPINDDALDHWVLVVANITEDECEIWDNNPNLPAQQRRKNLVNDTMSLLGEIFSSDLRESDLPPSAFSSYSFTYPDTTHHVPNKCDSSIFAIRHMQYYQERWFSNMSLLVSFNFGDERVRITLEIVNNPMNECYKKVWDCVYREEDEGRTFEEPPATEGVDGGD
ncbi:hypothetical protein ACLB2K_027201 [Fragaria x ananassa]